MKKIVHSRLLCILIMVSMLVLGIYCENIRTDSSFSGSDGKIGTVSLQAADNLADIHIYRGKSPLRLIEEVVLSRQSGRAFAVTRISQCLIAALFMADAYLLFLSIQKSALCIAGYGNQYNRRTLDYIHHNDGKKSHNLFLS